MTTLIQSFKHSNCGVGKLFGEVRESKVGCRHRVHHHHHIFCIIHTSICWSYKHGIIAFTEIHTYIYYYQSEFSRLTTILRYMDLFRHVSMYA